MAERFTAPAGFAVACLMITATFALPSLAPPAAARPQRARARVEPPQQALPVPPIPPRIAQGKDYEQCLKLLSANPARAQRFASAWEATGGGAGATHCLALSAIALGAPADGAEILDRLAGQSKATPTARASVYGQAGQAWLMASSPERALASSTLALSLTPDDPAMLVDRSIAEGTLQRYDQAAEDLTQALELDPNRVDALVFRAAARRHLNQVALAQQDVDRALAIAPGNDDALLERGLLRHRNGDEAGARRDWEQAAESAPASLSAELAAKNLQRLGAAPAQP